jgi:hypothetical protein
MSGPYILVPTALTDTMLSSSTISEPAAGETLWNAGTSYVQGDRVIRTQTHRIYENNVPGVNAALPELSLTGTTPRWQDIGPTNRWAAFDPLISTPSSIVTPMTYVLRPGLFNSMAFYGLIGSSLLVSIKSSPGGAVVYANTVELFEPPVDHYDYYFGVIKQTTKAFIKDLTPYADPEVTITITSGAGVTVKLGMLVFGDLRALSPSNLDLGTQQGAQAKPTSYSYISTDNFGVAKIVRRSKATDLDLEVFLLNADSDLALEILQQVLDIPAAIIGSDTPGFTGLNVFGLASGALTYEGPNHSIMSIQVKGFI